ncbi:zinc ribbon domain-containing protein [Dictyobacter kobayashii]|uniref:Zinc-ribbon domain-containing protein n=1 Tax=Dictyobacter kobayashii TaxID=2014872 RepID=A0A402AD98_9CHLR|nr:zinc ribbon domain-containing protein [Dictyobacter kobayashii]GCE17065.1 hypothetical protein KDK_08650 [Dictyobacter kobayashii]
MIFCGQCGLQLAPGSTRCPRCGAAIEEANADMGGELHTDDATIATPSLLAQNQTPSQPQAGGGQPLILRPGNSAPGNNDYGTRMPYDATSMMESTSQPQSPPMGNSYPGYPPQTGAGYAPQSGGNYPTQSGGNYPTQQNMYPDFTTHGAGAYGSGMSYPNQPQQSMGYPQVPNQYQQNEHAARAARGRTTGLILVLCGLIFILTAVVLFALQSGLFGGNKAVTPDSFKQALTIVTLHIPAMGAFIP